MSEDDKIAGATALGSKERNHLMSIRSLLRERTAWVEETATLDRLIAGTPVPPSDIVSMIVAAGETSIPATATQNFANAFRSFAGVIACKVALKLRGNP